MHTCIILKRMVGMYLEKKKKNIVSKTHKNLELNNIHPAGRLPSILAVWDLQCYNNPVFFFSLYCENVYRVRCWSLQSSESNKFPLPHGHRLICLIFNLLSGTNMTFVPFIFLPLLHFLLLHIYEVYCGIW